MISSTHKRILVAVISLFITAGSVAQVTNVKLSRKAEAHFTNREWKEAVSMYQILLMETPGAGELYPPAIIASGKTDDYEKMIFFVELSENNGIPLDSLFENTFALSMRVNDTPIYESMLLTVKEKQPWFKKIVNNYLLRYYNLRKENDKAIEIADEILSFSPYNTDVILHKAKALTDCGRNEEAAGCMKEILKKSPSSEEASLFLGNYYYLKGKKHYERLASKRDSIYADKPHDITDTFKTERDSIIVKYFIPAKSYLGAGNLAERKPYVKSLLNKIDNYIKTGKDGNKPQLKR